MARRLQEAGWGIKFISHVENRNKQKLQNRPWFNTTFSKLHVFGLTEFDKIVYLDADLLLLSNIDELFDKLPLEGHTDSLEDRPFAAASEVFPPDTFNSGERTRTRPRGTALCRPGKFALTPLRGRVQWYILTTSHSATC